MFAVSKSYASATDIACLEDSVERQDIITLQEFSCVTKEDCAVGVNAPLELEGKAFSGFFLIHSWRGNDDYDLAMDLRAEKAEERMVTYIYGTQEKLELSYIRVSYWAKDEGCPLSSLLKLKYNK